MFIIAGLGNPGLRYVNTRHNTGFAALDTLADRCGIRLTMHKYKGLCGQGMIGGEKVLLIKPQTYMNLSGECLQEAVHFYKVSSDHVIVMYDDISLPVGQLRIREKGSAGGHNGMKSIIAHLGTDVFPRIKIGIGEKPAGYDLADYVLGHYTDEDRKRMETAFDNAAKAAEMIAGGDVKGAMNRFNVRNRQIKAREEGESD